MKTQNNNPAFRNYAEVFAESKVKVSKKPSKAAVKDGVARLKVADIIEQRQLEKELAVLEC